MPDIERFFREAQTLMAAGRYAEALPRWSQLATLLGHSPFAAQVLMPLATCFWRTGDLDNAKATYERMRNDSDLTVRANALLGLGNLHEDIDEDPKAEEAYEALLDIAERTPDA